MRPSTGIFPALPRAGPRFDATQSLRAGSACAERESTWPRRADGLAMVTAEAAATDGTRAWGGAEWPDWLDWLQPYLLVWPAAAATSSGIEGRRVGVLVAGPGTSSDVHGPGWTPILYDPKLDRAAVAANPKLPEPGTMQRRIAPCVVDTVKSLTPRRRHRHQRHQPAQRAVVERGRASEI